MGLLEPTTVPGLDRALLQLLLIFGAVAAAGLAVTVGSIIGIVRAVRRRRRGCHSTSAVVLAAIGNAVATSWLLYWVVDDLRNRSNPFNGLFAINLAFLILPLSWLRAAFRANIAGR
jgi:hypothetical protein